MLRMKKSKVFFIIPTLDGGGAERVFTIVLNHLDHIKYELYLVLLRKEGKFLTQVPDHVHILSLNASRVLKAIPTLIRLTRLHKPDIIISGFLHVNLSILMLKWFFPSTTRIVVRETIVLSKHLRTLGKTEKVLLKLLIKWFYPLTNVIICQSTDMRDDLVKEFGINNDKLTIIRNPVDVTSLQKIIEDNPIQLSRHRYKIVAMGRLTYQKGFDLLINALAIVHEELNSVTLYLLGEGEELDSLKKKVYQEGLAGCVEFLGFVENPYRYLAAADVMAFSSRYEGFPNAVIESLACGTPVVAFNSPGGLNEIIVDDFNGWLVPEEDIQGFAKALIEAKNKKLNRDRIVSDINYRYNTASIINQYDTLLTNLLQR